MIYPKSFENLMESFQKLPGIGEKSSERFVYYIYGLATEDIEDFAKNLLNFKKKIKKCEICGHYTDEKICNICKQENRNKKVICVVEDSKSVFALEKSQNYKGVYHVLNGLISPIDNINPEDINLNSLVNDRIKTAEEIIIALNPSIEGETTSLYIQKLLEKKNIKISRLSYGIPVGTDIEYLDPIVVLKAFEDRKTIS